MIPYPTLWRKKEIKELLEQGYSKHISRRRIWAYELRKYPWTYFDHMLAEGRNISDGVDVSAQKYARMNWSSWELARSLLDESIKNSIGLGIYYQQITDTDLCKAMKRQLPSCNLSYVSNFTLPSLYFANFHAVCSGLHLSGVIPCKKKLLFRVLDHPHKWIPHDRDWCEGREYIAQETLLKQLTR